MTASLERPIRLVALLQDLEFGGTQRYAINLLKHVNRSLFDPELWLIKAGRDMLPLAEQAGITVVQVSGSSWVGPQGVARLGAALVKRPPDLLYTLTVVPNIWGRILGRLTRIPTIVSGYRGLFPAQFDRWLWPLSDRMICNAEALKQIMISRHGVDPRRIAVVPNAVDTEFFRPDPGEKAAHPLVLFAGRLVWEKAPLDALDGFRVALEEIPEAQMLFLGNGPFRAELEQRVEQLGLQSKVTLLPAASDIRPYLNRAWVFMLPSVQEASPNVIIEAMAMELPVVSTTVGGIPELVVHGTTGLLVQPGDRTALGSALAGLLKDEEKRLSMGAAGRERVLANHSLEGMVRRTEQVFLEAIRSGRGAPTEGTRSPWKS